MISLFSLANFPLTEGVNNLILTPNRRLAMAITTAHAEQSAKAVNCYAFNDWLEHLFTEYQQKQEPTVSKLLEPFAEQTLWEQVIIESDLGKSLLQLSATARKVQQAWEWSCLWQLNLAHTAFDLQLDTQIFKGWADAFKQRCQRQSLITQAELAQLLYTAFEASALTLPQSLVLVAFDDWPPLYTQLIQLLENLGTVVRQYEPKVECQQAVTLALANTEQEIFTAALWAKQIVETDTTATVGIVVPDLLQQRRTITRLFNEVLVNLAFNISGGTALSQAPVITLACKLLRFNFSTQTMNTLAAVLRSPFIKGAEVELNERALLEVELRQCRQSEITLKEFCAMTSAVNTCPLWLEMLQHYLDFNSRLERVAYPSQWLALFQQQLSIFGWPGERTLSLEEQQALQLWRSLLEDLNTLDRIMGQCDLEKILRLLETHLAQELLPAPVNTARIHVLGTLEAAGLEFSHLWVLGLHDQAWPSMPSPNPFLPLTLQKQFNLPHVSYERELAFTQKVTQRFLCSARKLVISYPLKQLDQERRISPLLQTLIPITLEALALAPMIRPLQTIYSEVTSQNDIVSRDKPLGVLFNLIPIKADEKIQGGANILKDQAACPFSAFAKYRLKASAVEKPSLGLDARERGMLLHHALDWIWTALKDQQTLLAKTEAELDSLFIEASRQAFIELNKLQQRKLPSQLLALEQQRLLTLLPPWFQLEKQRSSFKVAATEASQQIYLNQLPIKVRVDRIDQLEDGSFLYLDYKTSLVSANDWEGDRPNEPQLLLYSTQLQHRFRSQSLQQQHQEQSHVVAAVALGQLHTEKVTMKGLGSSKTIAPGIIAAANWQDKLQQWKRVVEELADNFFRGDTSVDPKYAQETCRYCQLPPLCRIHASKVTPEMQS